MSKPLNFILNSDFASLLNDSDSTTITVNIPAGVIIANGGSIQYSSTATIGTSGAPIIFSISDSADITGAYIARQLFCNPVSNSPSILVRVNRSNATTVIVRVFVYNMSGSNKTTVSRTINVKCRTFLPPFA